MILIRPAPVLPNTMKSWIRARKWGRSNTPSVSTGNCGAVFGAIVRPSAVRQGMKRSASAVSEPMRAARPSEVTSTALVRNSEGICALYVWI